jgi:hypothetical protein
MDLNEIADEHLRTISSSWDFYPHHYRKSTAD